MARGIKVDTKVSKFSRESATRKQTITTVDEHYQEWTKGENTAKSSGKLFDGKGKELKKVMYTADFSVDKHMASRP